mgnify:FL=1
MNDFQYDLYKRVKAVILATPTCPDGWMDNPCASCLAEAVARDLIDSGLVEA